MTIDGTTKNQKKVHAKVLSLSIEPMLTKYIYVL